MSTSGASTTGDGVTHRAERVSLWLGVLWPPAAALVTQAVTYVLVGALCEARVNARIALHIVPAIALLTVLLPGTSSLSRIHRASALADRFLAVLGALIAVLFTVVIVALWIPTFLLDPCLPPQ